MAPRKHITRMLAALNAANEAILRTSSEEELLPRVCKAAVSSGHFVFAAALLSGPDQSFQIAAGSGKEIDDAGTAMLSVETCPEYSQGLAASAFRTGRPAIIKDRQRDIRHSAAAIPIRKNGSSIGALVFGFQNSSALNDEAVWLLDRMAENVSFALDNFEQEKQRHLAEAAKERLARMFAALSATNEAIMRAETRAELCELVCEAAVLEETFNCTAIRFADWETNSLRVAAVAGPIKAAAREMRIPIAASSPEHKTLTEIAFMSRKACFSHDYLADPCLTVFMDVVQKTGTRSAAVFPLLKDKKPIGLLTFQSNEVGTFTPDLIELLQRIADNLSFALENFDRAEEKARTDERIKYLATHDGLTGLPNRETFSQLLNASIEMSQRHGRQFALLFVDLDRFKTINDTFGHADGDTLLIETGRRLRQSVRSNDVVARLGGDEFVVLLEDVTGIQQVNAAAHKLLETAMTPVLLGSQECRVTVSIGVAMFPADGADEKALMKSADTAMYLVKEKGKNGVRFHSKQMKPPSTERLTLEASLRRALELGELVAHYQPTRDLTTMAVTGVKALLCWDRPGVGFLPPEQFIPLAEDSGFIIPLGLWVLRTACHQNMSWQRNGLLPISMAVSLSARQFTHERLLDDVDQALAESGMPPELLQLEVTEGIVMQDVERTMAVLKALKNRGVVLAIDDFGGGLSSMALIRRFPVDMLKIDRSLIRSLRQSSGDKAISDAIIGLGNAMGITIIVEGLETTEQETFLRDRGCKEMQDYMFSNAVRADDVARLLKPRLLDSPGIQPLGQDEFDKPSMPLVSRP